MPKLLKTNTAVVQIPEKVLSAKGRQIKSTTSKGNISRKSINIETGGDKVKVIKEGDYAEPAEKKKRTYKKKEPVVKKPDDTKKKDNEPIVKKPDDTKKKDEAATKIAGAIKGKLARKEMAEMKKEKQIKFPDKVRIVSYYNNKAEYVEVKGVDYEEKFKPEGNISVDEYNKLYKKALLLVNNDNNESGTINVQKTYRTEEGTTVGFFIPFENYFKPLFRFDFTNEEFKSLEKYLIDGLLYIIIENYLVKNEMTVYVKGYSGVQFTYLIVPYMRKWIDNNERNLNITFFDTADTMIKYNLKKPPANTTAFKLKKALDNTFSNPDILKRVTKLFKELKLK